MDWLIQTSITISYEGDTQISLVVKFDWFVQTNKQRTYRTTRYNISSYKLTDSLDYAKTENHRTYILVLAAF